MDYSYKYPRPSVSVDIMIFHKSTKGVEILLITRKNSPFQNFYALPGGFMDMDETLLQAAIRELKEETNIDCNSLHQFGLYDAPDRDPRGRTLSVIYFTVLDEIPSTIKAGDDALRSRWFPLNSLPELAFDHTKILQDAHRLFEQ